MAKKKKNSPKADDKNPSHQAQIIHPVDEEDLKKDIAEEEALAKTNSDVLAELARKTAELAEQVKGPEGPKERVLSLDDPGSLTPENISETVENMNDNYSDDKLLAEQKAENTPANAAADMIRAKLKKIFKDEPDASEEAAESVTINSRSVHQEFMYNLTTSGKSLAEIQIAWHEYYTALNDEDKHQVWQEFYNNQNATSAYGRHAASQEKINNQNKTKDKPTRTLSRIGISTDNRSLSEIKAQVLDKVSAGGKLKPVHHLKSALFGIGLASFVGLIITFVFFNEVFVAPFISPSRTVSATPIIGNNQSDIGPEPKIIIPKINLEVPVVYDLKSVAEDSIQNALESGVVHFAASPEPGERGNSVIVGHSSNNILNSGKYKFAFVLLKRLEIDDTFYIQKDSVRYTYKVYEKKVVAPTNVSVLGETERENTITLITCDPPGTSVNRLIIVAEQISPDPQKNVDAVIDIEPSATDKLPSNSPSLWSRVTNLF